MKKQDELNQRNEYAKTIAKGLVELLHANEAKLVGAALKSRDGSCVGSYGDTGVARNRRIAGDALNELVKAVEAAVANPHKQTVSDKKVQKVHDACRANDARSDRGKLQYEVLVAGERVDTFFAENMTDAAMFADSLKLGKHEVKRLTKDQRNAERNAHATSPESENYWSS